MTERLSKFLWSPGPLSVEALDTNERAWAERQRIAAESDAEDEHARRRERLDRAGIYDSLTADMGRAVVSGDGLLPKKAVEALRAWQAARKTPPWLVLAGPKGCGKSVAAACAVADYTGFAVYISSAKFARVFSAKFGDALERRERAVECGFLVLDDPGSMDESASDMAVISNGLLELLDARKTSRRATILTTNLTRRALFERYRNDRLPDRLMELCQWVGISEGNMRGVAK